MPWLRRTLLATVSLLASGVGAVAWTYPALAAAVCAPCAGLERVTPTLVVEPSMDAATRAELLATREAASQRVADFFGTRSPALDGAVLVACVTEACDRRLGGRGPRATAYSTPVLTAIRLSPRGLDRTIVAHELAHVAIHERAGHARQRSGAFPAWFDEGLAVIVSRDTRYVREGRATRCAPGALPSNPHDWAALTGREPMIYADAACRVLRWLQAHGGRDGLLHALEERRSLP